MEQSFSMMMNGMEVMNRYLVTFEGRELGSTAMLRRVCGEVEAESPEAAIEVFTLTHGGEYELIRPLNIDLRHEGL
jgi:hypothetical protein